jgi:hypothetical protein
LSAIYDFKIDELRDLLELEGLEKTWLRILATHLNSAEHFRYILKTKEFKNVSTYDRDLIANLSIGEIGVLYEYSVSYSNADSRKSNGQFFTPDDVALFMANKAKTFERGIWMDPCAGIGNLSWHLVAIQENPESFLLDRLIVMDIDKLALLIARTLLTVSFQDKCPDLFTRIAKRFVVFDFLSVSENRSPDLFEASGTLNRIPLHDFVIVNPPYLATEVDPRFETAQSGDLYSYFLENVIKTSKGFVSITPQSFTNARKFAPLRELMLSKFHNMTIYAFDNVPANIFKGIKFGSKNSNQVNSTRASILVAIEGPGKHQISPLMRWTSDEREEVFDKVDDFLSDVPLTRDFFPKVAKNFKDLYMEVVNNEPLGTILSPHPTNFPLHIPSAPRYFIPALMNPVSRASQKVVFFRNARDRKVAYMLINSSYFYWWWRVRDGGMTLSQETISSVPLIKFEVDESVISALKRSEKTNRVYKMNAGASQENVKHPVELLDRLNRIVKPEHADLLISLHQNSELKSVKPSEPRAN